MPFDDNAAHVLAEVGWLELLVRHAVLNERKEHGRGPDDPFKGLYISDHEVERLVAAAGHGEAGDDDSFGVLLDEAVAMRHDIDARRQSSAVCGVNLALPHLARVFSLRALEEHIVLLALAGEIEQKYERLFGWLQDDITKKRPTVALALRLLCAGANDRLAARAVFASDAPLLRARLVRALDKPETGLLGQPLVLDDAIANFLLTAGHDVAPPPGVRTHATQRPFETLRWSERMRKELSDVAGRHVGEHGSARHLIFQLHGQHGAGRKTLAACLCGEIGAELIVVDIDNLMRRGEGFEDALRAAFRHGLLHGSAVYLDHTAALIAEDDRAAAAREALRRVLGDLGWLAFVATEMPWACGDLFRDHAFISVDLPMPDIAEREALWVGFAAESSHRFASDADWRELAGKFRLTPGQIKRAIETAANRSCLRGVDAVIAREDLHRGCYAQSNQKLATLSRRLHAHHTWADITLPPSALAQLHEICAQVRHRRTVYADWGFEKKLSLGKGLAVLFYGQSGVGKTMAVEVITNELQLEAYKIDLSTIVSKYIGETEKNLSRIFREAECSNAILFFDEADALFGRRTEVKDAHDRYANIETNYLLQRMEEFEGLAILATNLRKNIDDGFFRRMHFAIEFPFPDAAHRYRIWQKHLPADAPVKADIDFDYLAKRFNLSGGNIRNVVVNAAFLAAESGTAIGMEHLIRATRREYEKTGRICTDMDFQPYQSWLAEAKSAS
jgi:hypothetical protein